MLCGECNREVDPSSAIESEGRVYCSNLCRVVANKRALEDPGDDTAAPRPRRVRDGVPRLEVGAIALEIYANLLRYAAPMAAAYVLAMIALTLVLGPFARLVLAFVGEGDDWHVLALPLLLLPPLVSAWVSTLMYGWFAVTTARRARGLESRLWSSVDPVIDNPLGLLALALGGTLLTVLGLLLGVVPGIWISCALAVAPVALLEERLGPVSAFRRGWALSRGRRLFIVTLQLVANVPALLAAAVLVARFGVDGIVKSPLSVELAYWSHLPSFVILACGAVSSGVLYARLTNLERWVPPPRLPRSTE